MPTKRIKSKRKKTDRQLLEKECDDLLSIKVREAGHKSDIPCYFAGRDNVRCSGVLQCNHIIGRINKRLRWDYMNVVPGCSGHNLYYHFNEPDLHRLIERIDPKRWEYLINAKWQSGKRSKSDLKLVMLYIENTPYIYKRVL